MTDSPMSNPLIAQLQAQLQELGAQGLYRNRRIVATPCAPQLAVDGRRVLSFNSNDYLGLAADARVVEALREGASRYGAGSGASHLVSGHGLAHSQLEEKLAEFIAPHVPSVRALYFSSGYLANLGVLGALSSPDPANTEVFSDALNHASLIDAARLSRAVVKIYPHGDLAALDTLLSASPAKNMLVVTDGVFSMDGDIAPLPALLALCERHGAWLVVDDAHGFGVLGENGRGVLEHFDLCSPLLVYMGTLGKAAGVAGAFVAAHETVASWLVQRARTYIYTTAAPPAVAHALITSLHLIGGEVGRQRRLHLAALRQAMADLALRPGWTRLLSDTPIQPLVIGGNTEVLQVSQVLLDLGVWVSAIRAPTVPPGLARLRITLSASHTLDDVAQLKSALQTACERTIPIQMDA
jgi:8-amino-7-oxononanoate synthase